MMKSDVLDTLFAARRKVSTLIIALAPRNDAERASLSALLRDRDRLTAAINQVIDQQFTASWSRLDAAASELAGAGQKLEAVEGKVEKIESVLGLVDEVLGAAAKVVGVVAGG
jgi:hypothetical protein